MIKEYFNNNNLDRTQKVNLNTILSILFRGGSILLQFALIPLTINYINPDVYGVWLTLSSLVGWVAMFDVGIGNGFKNKLSESLAIKDFEKAKVYVSTTYVIIGVIACLLIVLFFLGFRWIKLQNVFNSSFIPEAELHRVVAIVSLFFLLKFISDIINVVASSFQMSSISSVLLFISNLGLTISVWILTKTTNANLTLLALCLSVIPFLISLAANFYLFRRQFKVVKPSFKHVDFKYAKSIISLGSQFFILQIIVLILYQTDNILIAQFFSPAEVTNFNIAYKYYSLITVLFTILLIPYWTAFTEAYQKNDFDWIRLSIKKLLFYWGISTFFLGIMLFMANPIIKLWVGDTINISFSLSLSICAYIAVSNWIALFTNFSNGVGKLRLQIFYSIIMGIVNIPLCFALVKKFNFGSYAMPLSNFICLIIGAVISYIQYVKIINGKATGIWNK
jgi:O-antigen/teichoic acid export membrane protein